VAWNMDFPFNQSQQIVMLNEHERKSLKTLFLWSYM
jgi:hypothetical protein